MNSLYICESGIKLWEQPARTTAPDFTTFSILDNSISDIWANWQKLAEALLLNWPITMKWRTIGHSLEQYKVQELLLRKEISKDLNSADIIKKNEKTKIYSYIQHINIGDTLFNPNELTQYRNTLLLLNKSEPNIEKTWEKLSITDKGVSSDHLANFLCNERESIIGRFIENDTYSVAQIICSAEHRSSIEILLKNIHLRQISAAEIPKAIENL
jgi:hypothetical protein